MDAIETFEVNGLTVEIFHDSDGSHANPRDNCNLGTFYGKHRRYMSPDKIPLDFDPQKKMPRDVLCLPVWMYDHGGTAYAAAESNPFHCPWDSGLFGVVFVTHETLRKEYGVKRVTQAIRAKALQVLQSEVAEYSQWANGEVYGYTVTDSDGEQVDSCWGFIGLEVATSEARSAAQYAAPTRHAA